MRFCFVILHYRTEQDTIECVNSIVNLNGLSDIVIVDNASNNGSIEKVEKMFESYRNIYIIKNKENLGFSAGNNIGYKYAKNSIKSDFIVVLNNDIIIPDKNFKEKVVTLYMDTQFDIAGPNIESMKNHEHQNPMTKETLSLREINKEILRYRLLRIFNRTSLYDKLRKETRKKEKRQILEKYRKEDVILHGSFIIFSKKFIDKEDQCFRLGTFLYMEEVILYHYCKINQYKIVYEPDILVYHKEDSSTDSLFKSSKEKRDFVFLNMIKSLKIYAAILRETKKSKKNVI